MNIMSGKEPIILKNLEENENSEPLITHFKWLPYPISFSNFSKLLAWYIDNIRGDTYAQ
jgi:hypothetical protein